MSDHPRQQTLPASCGSCLQRRRSTWRKCTTRIAVPSVWGILEALPSVHSGERLRSRPTMVRPKRLGTADLPCRPSCRSLRKRTKRPSTTGSHRQPPGSRDSLSGTDLSARLGHPRSNTALCRSEALWHRRGSPGCLLQLPRTSLSPNTPMTQQTSPSLRLGSAGAQSSTRVHPRVRRSTSCERCLFPRPPCRTPATHTTRASTRRHRRPRLGHRGRSRPSEQRRCLSPRARLQQQERRLARIHGSPLAIKLSTNRAGPRLARYAVLRAAFRPCRTRPAAPGASERRSRRATHAGSCPQIARNAAHPSIRPSNLTRQTRSASTATSRSRARRSSPPRNPTCSHRFVRSGPPGRLAQARTATRADTRSRCRGGAPTGSSGCSCWRSSA